MPYVDTDRLIAAVRRRLRGETGRFTAADEDAIESAIREYMRRQPAAPKLVSRQTAAKMLGYQSAHLGRLDGRLPPKIDIDGGRYAYEQERIEALARELEAERQETITRKESAV